MNEQEAQSNWFEAALAAARVGDEGGLGELFRFFQPRLIRYLRATEPGRADDVAADTWMSVAASINAFEGDVGNFAAWLFTIARRRLTDHRRSAGRRRTDPVAVVPEAAPARSGEDITVDSMSAQEAVDFITKALTKSQADVVLLRVLAGLSPAEVASLIGRDEGWVRVTYHRALHRLRDRMPIQNNL